MLGTKHILSIFSNNKEQQDYKHYFSPWMWNVMVIALKQNITWNLSPRSENNSSYFFRIFQFLNTKLCMARKRSNGAIIFLVRLFSLF